MKPLLNFDSESLKALGVLDWGYDETSVPVSFTNYQNWAQKGLCQPLQYLLDERQDLRSDIKKVYPEFQSAIVFLFSYQNTKKWMLENNQHQVASYTLGFNGEDYHFALKRRLDLIAHRLEEYSPGIKYFISLDAQPILERDLAHRAGLGWFGKNSMLIHKKHGSYFLIGSLLLNQKLQLDVGSMDEDHCGQCMACVEACPTNAIDPETRTLTANKCISTFTIETFKEELPPPGMEKSRGEFFGCDICQDVCPWNKKPLDKITGELKLSENYSFLKNWFYSWPKEKLYSMIERETNRGFKRLVFGTPFDRPGRLGWLKNLKVYFQPK